MRVMRILWAGFALIHSAIAIFADDAFHIDYHHALLGIPQSHATFFHKPQSSSNASLLYALSDKAYLGAVNPKDGSNLWRQPLSAVEVTNATNTFLVAGDRDGQVISGYGNSVNSWDALDGRLRWSFKLPAGKIVFGLQTPQPSGSEEPQSQGVVILAGSSSGDGGVYVSRLSGAGEQLWEHVDTSPTSGSLLALATSSKSAFVVVRSHGLLAGSKTKVHVLDIATGRETGSSSPALDSEVLAVASCPRHPYIVTTEKPYTNIKVNILGDSKVLSATVDTKAEDIMSLAAIHACSATTPTDFLIHAISKDRQWADIFHLDGQKAQLSKTYSLPALGEGSSFAAEATGSEVYFVRTSVSEISLYSSASHARLGRWPIKTTGSSFDVGVGSHAATEVVTGKSGFAVRVAEVSSKGYFSLLRNGEAQWSRPEALAYAIVGSWVDDASIRTFKVDLEAEASISPLTAYLHRVKRHVNDLATLPSLLQRLPASLSSSPDEPILDTKSHLIGDKLALIGTSRRDLIAIDASDAGSIAWQTNLADTTGTEVAFTYLTTEDGRTTAYLSDGSFVVVNTTSGAMIEYVKGSLSASKIAVLPASPAAAVIKIDHDGKPQIAADFPVPATIEGNVIVTLSDAGTAFGWTIGQEPRRTWTLRPKAGARFTSAISRSDQEPVASIGKVLGDRAVLYKYISPNLALLTATASTSATFYLVDAVTGSVLHTSSYGGLLAGSPVPVAMSENWFAFAYTSQDSDSSSLSTQLIISELYESEASNDRGFLASRQNYSSFSADAGATPYIISQAYTVSESISHLAVTQTGQGITSRQLVAVLPDSSAIVAIPREILNARRPVDREATRDEQEEGLFKYSPSLEFDPKWYLTHSREVVGMKNVLTSPSLLESTGLVFAFGHDVFGTQVNPSGSFDVLGKGFNKIQLSLTVVALFFGVMAVRPMVRSRTVDGHWKA